MNMRHNRRGLSAVVGAIFMILIMLGALNAFLFVTQEQGRLFNALTGESDTNLNRLNEKIAISELKVNGNKMNMTVINSGGATARLASVYVVNETASPDEQYRFNLSDVVDNNKSVTNIGQSLPLTIKSNTDYSVKVVTYNGNTAAVRVGSLSNTALALQLFVVPGTVAPGGNVTLLMAATNNNREQVIVDPVYAVMTYSTSCVPDQVYSCKVTAQSALFSGNGTTIAPGSTAFFQWVYTITAPDKTPYTFTASIYQGKPGNTVTGKLTVKLLDSYRSTVSTTTDVLTLKYLNNVGLSLIVPGPFGKQGGGSPPKAVWGVVVSNPTEQTLSVTKVSISLTSPTGGDNMIQGCTPTAIQPSTGTWSLPATNVLQWKAASGSPLNIQAFKSTSFIVACNTGNPTNELPSALVTATAFTSSGQFSKTGYSTGISAASSAMTNVYLANTNQNTTLTSNIVGHLNNIPSGSTVKFNVTLTDYELTTSYKINSGARIIVYLPPGWIVQDFTLSSTCLVTSVSCYGGFNQPVKIKFTDNSTQITATRYSDITGLVPTVAGTIAFTATAPVLTDSARIYIMTIATDGDINSPSGFTQGAIAEVPLQVNKQ